MNNRRVNKDDVIDDVDLLLQAAQDEVILGISTDSHISRVAPDYLDSNLDRRFQALKSKPSNSKPQQQKPPILKKKPSPVGGDDDISARFAALKATLPSSSTHLDLGPNIENYPKEDDEDEVEKLVKWAIDAARLDPSPPSDEEESVNSEHSDSDSDSDDDHRVANRRKKENKKTK